MPQPVSLTYKATLAITIAEMIGTLLLWLPALFALAIQRTNVATWFFLFWLVSCVLWSGGIVRTSWHDNNSWFWSVYIRRWAALGMGTAAERTCCEALAALLEQENRLERDRVRLLLRDMNALLTQA